MGKYSSFIAPIGINLRSKRSISPDTLSEVLKPTVNFLQTIEPTGSLLRKYADWWEHDGLHFDEGEIDFPQLSDMVQTTAHIKAAMSREFEVFIGIASQDFRWYLRFYHSWENDGRDELGRFDVTLPSELIAPFRQQVLGSLSVEVQEQESLSYYLSIGMDAYT